jgi:hypothetical protein
VKVIESRRGVQHYSSAMIARESAKHQKHSGASGRGGTRDDYQGAHHEEIDRGWGGHSDHGEDIETSTLSPDQERLKEQKELERENTHVSTGKAQAGTASSAPSTATAKPTSKPGRRTRGKAIINENNAQKQKLKQRKLQLQKKDTRQREVTRESQTPVVNEQPVFVPTNKGDSRRAAREAAEHAGLLRNSKSMTDERQDGLLTVTKEDLEITQQTADDPVFFEARANITPVVTPPPSPAAQAARPRAVGGSA